MQQSESSYQPVVHLSSRYVGIMDQLYKKIIPKYSTVHELTPSDYTNAKGTPALRCVRKDIPMYTYIRIIGSLNCLKCQISMYNTIINVIV